MTDGSVYATTCLAFPFGYLINEFIDLKDYSSEYARGIFGDDNYSNHEYYRRLFDVSY